MTAGHPRAAPSAHVDSHLAHRVPAPLLPDRARVVAQVFLPAPEPGAPPREAATVARIMRLPEDVVQGEADRLLVGFSPRHRDLPKLLAANLAIVAGRLPDLDLAGLSAARAQLVGACFTAEYAVEGAALCNPSAVPHPDQSGLQPGQLRVAVSLRGIGEGHLSSVGFATAVVGPATGWVFDRRDSPAIAGTAGTAGTAGAVADDGAWQVSFPPGTKLSQEVLLPVAAEESHGLEDVRLVRFTDDDGTVDYRGTYTAYDGRNITPRLLRSTDLRTFTSSRLTGPAARNKGMALFPRPVGGRLLALCRTDGVSNSLSSSSDGLTWEQPQPVEEPERSWEVVQIGNCGSPLETDRGWLVLTHGVGAMRAYSIGAVLLDLDDPAVMIGRLDEPLLRPSADEQDGYVPQVVYSCGGLVHAGTLWLPYGIGDVRIGVVRADLTEVLDAMTPV